jgi:hypothetical protein
LAFRQMHRILKPGGFMVSFYRCIIIDDRR